MAAFFEGLLATDGLTPHGFCLLWEPGLIWLHAVSDTMIGLAYFSIPVALIHFVRKREDLAYRWVGTLFAVFILSCGTTHFIAVATLWLPVYWLDGLVKAFTAIVSVVTAILLWPLIPRLLALPSPSGMRAVNEALQTQIGERDRALELLGAQEATLRILTASLEQRVAQRTASLTEVNQRFQAALRASNVTLFTQDAGLAYTWVSKEEYGVPVADMIGETDETLLPPASSDAVLNLKRHVLASGEPSRAEVSIEREGHESWYEMTIQPMADADGHAAGIIGGAIEITHRKEQERRIRLLMRETTHRAKNLLAVVQAISRQTSSNSASIADFQHRFSARLQSLAGSHDLLVQENWQGAWIDELIESQLGHYTDRVGSQIELSGPRLQVAPEAAQHIGMALHELATNAAKYGALSVPEGKVRIVWGVQSEPNGERHCHLAWTESNGPPVTPPTSSGFGRTVIERTVGSAVAGTTTIAYRPEGVRWTLQFPMRLSDLDTVTADALA